MGALLLLFFNTEARGCNFAKTVKHLPIYHSMTMASCLVCRLTTAKLSCKVSGVFKGACFLTKYIQYYGSLLKRTCDIPRE